MDILQYNKLMFKLKLVTTPKERSIFCLFRPIENSLNITIFSKSNQSFSLYQADWDSLLLLLRISNFLSFKFCCHFTSSHQLRYFLSVGWLVGLGYVRLVCNFHFLSLHSLHYTTRVQVQTKHCVSVVCYASSCYNSQAVN